jgi:ADP-heptose:LPS heptosyltransferase
VPARAWPPDRFHELAQALTDDGIEVVVTGAPSERALTGRVTSGTPALDLGGRTSLPELAAVLESAAVVVAGNTGPAHLAAAVRTPIVSLFAPTVPSARWAPYRVPTVLLGEQDAPCRDTRATQCPVEGHPCLTSVPPDDVIDAVKQLCGELRPRTVRTPTRSTA